MEPFLLGEAPRILFPFARRVIADAVRDGGFPPLMLEPIDFTGIYLQQRAQAGDVAQGEIAGNA
jgi:preprotein translocase subunit SecB